MKLLIFIPSPRNLKQFHEAIEKLPYDKIWMRNMPYKHDPYGKAHKHFIDNKEYTHFAICPDDLIVTKKGIEQLLKDTEKYDVVGGLCNVNMKDLEESDPEYAITKNLPNGDLTIASYQFYRKSEIPKNQMFEVQWSGTAFMILPRWIMEQIELKPYIDKGPNDRFAFDVGIAHQLIDLGISQYVDTRVFFKHYRLARLEFLRQGKEDVWIDRVGHPREYLSGEKYDIELIDVNDLPKEKIAKLWVKPIPKCEITQTEEHRFDHQDHGVVYCLCGTIKT